MDLSIYTNENARRTPGSTQVDDTHLIRWDPADPAQNTFIPVPQDSHIVSSGGNSTNFTTRHEFQRRFQLLTHGLLNYIDWTGVVVAGGCVSNAINADVNVTKVTKHPKGKDPAQPAVVDIDMFLYGPGDPKIKTQQLLDDISRAAKDRENDYVQMRVLKNEYVISLINSNNHNIKVQLVLRVYKNIYEILAGFDIDSSAVAYDGSSVWLTARSLNAFRTRLNVVDMSRRSPSYEYRLNKYTRRGFGIYIPFEWSTYNKLYFLNRYSQGLDKLLILQRYNRRTGLQRLLNYITKRRNIKFENKPVSDYDGGEDLELSGNDIARNIARFNMRVAEPFRYTLYDSADTQALINSLQFMTQNPGQQLTGSFNPITTGDWVHPDYSPLTVDFIGRSSVLMSIKKGQPVDLETLYTVRARDNSLFNVLDYLIMYHPDDELLIRAWDSRHRFMFARSYNLYNIEPLALAMICRRYALVQHILAKYEPGVVDRPAPNTVPQQTVDRYGRKKQVESEYTNKLDWNDLIDIALFLDDLTLLKCIFRYHKNSIYDQQRNAQKYRCVNIGKHFGLQLQAADNSLVSLMNNKTPQERINTILRSGSNFSRNEYHTLLSVGDYQSFTDAELRLYAHHSGDLNPLFGLLIRDVRRDVILDQTFYDNAYPGDSFEFQWFQRCCNLIRNTENNKPPNRHARAITILRQLFPRKQIEEALVVTFKNPIETMNPLWLAKARKIWQRDYTDLFNIKLWSESDENDFYRSVVFWIDDISVVKQFIEDKHMPGFLGKWRDSLGNNLRGVWEEIKAQQVNLNNAIHRDHANALCNTPAHLAVLETGKLVTDGIFVENAFGQTPYDYALGQLLHLFCGNRVELKDSDLDMLINLRESTSSVDRTIPVIACTLNMVTNSDLDILVDRI